jgi:cytochrome c oxidase assembly protein subunit 15
MEEAAKWLNPAPIKFYVHRSFSLIVVLINVYLFLSIRKMNLIFPIYNWVLIILGVEILTGILMYYFEFPTATQPIHLLLASLLFGAQLYFLFQLFNRKQNTLSHDI